MKGDSSKLTSVILENLKKLVPQYQSITLTLNDVLSVCPRFVYMRRMLNKPQFILIDAIRQAGKEPILRALSMVGWQVTVPYIDTIGGLEIRDVVDALKGEKVALVTIGRPDSLTLLKLNAFVALLDAEVGYLIFANPRNGNIGVRQLTLSPARKREILELIQRKVELLATYLSSNKLPPRAPVPLCPRCPLADVCKALEVIKYARQDPPQRGGG